MLHVFGLVGLGFRFRPGTLDPSKKLVSLGFHCCRRGMDAIRGNSDQMIALKERRWDAVHGLGFQI